MNTLTEVIIAKTFTHPSGMQYRAGAKIKLTDPIGVKAWLKEGWIIAPSAPASTPATTTSPVVPPVPSA